MLANEIPVISADEFFDYSLQFYFQSHNQENLIWLQDNVDVNVNIALLLMYFSTKCVCLSVQDLKAINNNNENLDSLTSNIRQKRRALKDEHIARGLCDYKTSQYKELLAKELELEKKQQVAMIEFAQSCLIHAMPRINDNKGDSAIFSSLNDLKELSENSIHEEAHAILTALMDEQKKLAGTFGKRSDE
ncbi:MAG: hypothetical protein ACJAVV_000954 [Alphaproteobacteria bacterium]|jgi:uncharacterized protein (TIGR02444 family)